MQDSKGLKGLVMAQLDARSSEAGTRVLASAASLKRIAGDLRSGDSGYGLASLAEGGGERLERFGDYLINADGETLIGDAERLGRERPWTVATMGIVLGLAGSRMLKASAAARARDGRYGS